MKQLTLIMLGIGVFFFQSCQPTEPKPTQSNVEVVKLEVTEESNKIVFENLDQVLSPFEDMTEFALDKNDGGVSESLTKVEDAIAGNIFTKNLTPESMKLLTEKIEKLKELINQKNYGQIALVSTDIFEYNVSNFMDAKKVENQIQIEHLDYMGFKILALLHQDKIDWKNIEHTISSVQKQWMILSPNVKDNNLKDSFEYLFEGLHLSVEHKDFKMGETLASMNLSLVDVLENSF